MLVGSRFANLQKKTFKLHEVMQEAYFDCPEIMKDRILERKIGRDVVEAPKVSVIIPAYNISEFVKETLDSVFAQTFTNYEVILVNDGSKDTADLEKNLEPYYDKLIYLRQENSGAAFARNTAICLSRGEVLAFLDGDDVWHPDYLKSQLNCLETNGYDLVYTDAELFGTKTIEGKTYMQTSPSNGKVTPESLISANCNVITSGTMIQKKWVKICGMFDSKLKRMQDFDLWFRMAKNGAYLGYQKEVLLKYRVRPDSLSGNNIQRAERNITGLHTLRKKYELTPDELRVWEKQLKFSEAELSLEKGKSSLLQQKFDESEKHFQEANLYFQSLKLKIILVLLKTSPKLLLKFYRKWRADEIEFVATDF